MLNRLAQATIGITERIIEENQRVLVTRNGRFDGILGPGKHRIFTGYQTLRFDVFDVTTPTFQSPLDRILMRDYPDTVAENFAVADTGDHQIAIVRVGGKLHDILSPGTFQLYWTVLQNVEVELVDVSESYEIPSEVAKKLASLLSYSGEILYQLVPDAYVALLYVDGELKQTLGPGAHAFWRVNRTISAVTIDTRLQEKEIAGQEILTSDQVGIRVTVTCHFRITEPAKMASSLANLDDYLHKTIQFGIRKAVGGKRLDELLETKEGLDEEIRAYAEEKLRDYGVTVHDVGVKDVILPGEMREILNQVMEAEKRAQANLIRRREETAATRSLLNTAKLMEDNAVLLRLKELETLERVVERIGTLNVYGGLDSLLDNLIKLKGKPAA